MAYYVIHYRVESEKPPKPHTQLIIADSDAAAWLTARRVVDAFNRQHSPRVITDVTPFSS